MCSPENWLLINTLVAHADCQPFKKKTNERTMKQLSFYVIILATCLFAACQKTEIENPIIIDPIEEWKLIKTDSITSGMVNGLAIGAAAEETYVAAKQLLEQHTHIIHVVGNIYQSLPEIKEKLGLYTSLFFDEEQGTSTGIQLNFENDQIKSIYTNNGDRLSAWPLSPFNSPAVNVGMAVSDVYNRLLNMSKKSAYAAKFQRLSLFSKNTDKAYDPAMSHAPQWYFGTSTETELVRYTLYFKEGKLVSVVKLDYEHY